MLLDALISSLALLVAKGISEAISKISDVLAIGLNAFIL